MNHQTFNKKSCGFLLYFTFQGLQPLLTAFMTFICSIISHDTKKIKYQNNTIISVDAVNHSRLPLFWNTTSV